MKLSRLQNHPQYLLCLIGVLGMVLLFSQSTYASDPRPLPVDDMFEKSMADLRTTMEKARSSNEAFKEQNRALRQEVERLEQSLTSLSDQKITVKKDVLVSVDQDTLADKENALYEARIKNLALRLSRFEDEKKRLEKRIKFFDEDNQNSQTEIAKLKEDVAQMLASSSKEDQPIILKKAASDTTRIKALEKQLAFQKQILQKNTSEKNKLKKDNAQLSAEFSLGKTNLVRAKKQANLVGREFAAERSEPNQSEKDLREQIANLEDYRRELKASLEQLKKATVAVKPSRKIDLQNILQQLEQQQSLLKKKMSVLEKSGNAIAKRTNTNEGLLARKESLSIAKSDLLTKIAVEKKQYDTRPALNQVASSAADPKIKSKIQESTKRVLDLQSQINNVRKSLVDYTKSQELASQVEKMEKELQVLRNKPKEFSPEEDVSLANQSEDALKQEIAQLESRRDILASSVNVIHSKYRLDDISTKDPGAKEAQLKEYWDTLIIENAALQQKLLTLQMRQDKNSQPNL